MRLFAFTVLVTLFAAAFASSRDKTVWSYEGGLFMITNGSIPNGACFRLTGRVTSSDFFDHLKRFDKPAGTIFRRGDETVATFPDQLTLNIMVHDQYDQTCPPAPTGPDGKPSIKLLTREMMSSLNLYLYWKHGVELRPIANVQKKFFAVRETVPQAAVRMYNLQQKLEWSYEYIVPSAGVPLTDSLVLVLRTQDDHVAARVSARL
jgi:hypothetical protein